MQRIDLAGNPDLLFGDGRQAVYVDMPVLVLPDPAVPSEEVGALAAPN